MKAALVGIGVLSMGLAVAFNPYQNVPHGFAWPTEGDVTQPYHGAHRAIDIAGYLWQPIFSAADGEIIAIESDPHGLGNYVKIEHDGGVQTTYGHMDRFAENMQVGQRVKKCQHIGDMGSTGNSNGPHTHFETDYNGKKINPLYVLSDEQCPTDFVPPPFYLVDGRTYRHVTELSYFSGDVQYSYYNDLVVPGLFYRDHGKRAVLGSIFTSEESLAQSYEELEFSQELIEHGYFEEAEETLRTLIENNPNDPLNFTYSAVNITSRYVLARAVLYQGRIEEAKQISLEADSAGLDYSTTGGGIFYPVPHPEEFDMFFRTFDDDPSNDPNMYEIMKIRNQLYPQR